VKAQLGAEQAINDKQRDLEQRRAQNAATVAEAEAKKQTALAIQREAELKATQIAQASADAARVRIAAEAAADPMRSRCGPWVWRRPMPSGQSTRRFRRAGMRTLRSSRSN